MSTERALEIISKNYNCEDGSLISSLNDKSSFSEELFRELYDSIVLLTKESFYNEELTEQISVSYQSFLKLIIYHFSPYDMCEISDFPKEYDEYIERLDQAVLAYYRRNEYGKKKNSSE